ncbi:hypothetical protein AAT19DRAFT_14990 [Rhodotorula toruloides]|uniref:Uncharacterized protein n=1 Tax=Rhodotorula toruloides TaxID=5286 RepID=A0A2T0A9D5_RHOTO|nr:hypothetical protein AAT19DRAFT_14990 [Rhodotorula toruloides]
MPLPRKTCARLESRSTAKRGRSATRRRLRRPKESLRLRRLPRTSLPRKRRMRMHKNRLPKAQVPRDGTRDVEKAPDDDARRRKTQKQQPAAERVKRGARSPAPDPTPQVKAEVAGVGDPLGGQLSAFLSTLSPDFNFSRHTSLFLHQDIETPRQLRAIARGGEAELKALAEDLKKDVVGEDGARVKGMSAAWANRFVAVMMENVKKDGQA